LDAWSEFVGVVVVEQKRLEWETIGYIGPPD
jgi:hypothetical protein